MARQPRKKSPTGIYHVMARGIGKMVLFPRVTDKTRYYSLLTKYKKLLKINFYAYCLMSNHVHLLLKENDDNLAELMHRMGISYSQYFNRKYERVGHVFQNRYLSEPVADENHFIECARYIHNNPVKAGLVKSPAEYNWSSYNNYLAGNESELIDMDTLLLYFSQDKLKAISELRHFTEQEEEAGAKFAEVEDDNEEKRTNTLREIVIRVLAKRGIELDDIRSIPPRQRAVIIRAVKESIDCSTRELAAILKVSKDTVNRA